MHFTQATIALFAILTSVTASPVSSVTENVGTAAKPDIIEWLKSRAAANSSTLVARDSDGWTCDGGDNGLRRGDALREEDTFTRLFGMPALTAAPAQCYVSFCRGNAYGWCNVAGSNRKEDRDDRWEGADRYRGGGAWSRRCDYVNNRDPFVMHIFGKENDWTWSRNAAIRRC